MQNYVEQISQIFKLYKGDGTEVLFYLIILIIMLRISSDKRFKTYILYPSIVEILFVINPISIAVFVNTGLLPEKRYVRLFWLLQVSLVMGGICYECIQKTGEKVKEKRSMVIILLIGILLITGNYTFINDNFQSVSNLYKLPEEAIEVADSIRENCDLNGKDVSEVRIAVPVTLAPYIRQYDGNIKMLYGRGVESNIASSEVQRLQQEEELNIQEISMYAKDGQCDYIVLEECKPFSEDPERYGYELVDSVKGYAIYRDTSLYG